MVCIAWYFPKKNKVLFFKMSEKGLNSLPFFPIVELGLPMEYIVFDSPFHP